MSGDMYDGDIMYMCFYVKTFSESPCACVDVSMNVCGYLYI